MGSIQSRNKENPSEKEMIKVLREKLRDLEEEVSEITRMRENESGAHGRERIVYGLKEAELRRERKRLREEVRKLRKRLEEREDEMVMREKKRYLAEEEMREERVRRDDTVEKWKRLYLAIKVELDDLIQRTHQGEGLCWKAEEEGLILDELQKELKAKEDSVGK